MAKSPVGDWLFVIITENQKMFIQLKPLLQNCARLTLNLVANNDGTLSVTILPKSKQTGEAAAALNTPLSITATAEELDEKLPQVLLDYVQSHESLAVQLENTTSILDAAKAESQKKATTAISNTPAKANSPKSKAAESSEEESEEELVEDSDDSNDSTPSVVATATAAPVVEESIWG